MQGVAGGGEETGGRRVQPPSASGLSPPKGGEKCAAPEKKPLRTDPFAGISGRDARTEEPLTIGLNTRQNVRSSCQSHRVFWQTWSPKLSSQRCDVDSTPERFSGGFRPQRPLFWRFASALFPVGKRQPLAEGGCTRRPPVSSPPPGLPAPSGPTRRRGSMAQRRLNTRRTLRRAPSSPNAHPHLSQSMC